MGEAGEIVIRSPFAFNGYLQQEAKGMTIDVDGWIKTDDAGCLEGGYVNVFGRKSNVISRGAVLIHPADVERMIINAAGVAEVIKLYHDNCLFYNCAVSPLHYISCSHHIIQVAVIGVPDKRLGQNICACIVPDKGVTLTSKEMMKYFDHLHKPDEGHLGMTPAYFMFLDDLPTVHAKIDRRMLLKMAVEKFNL